MSDQKLFQELTIKNLKVNISENNSRTKKTNQHRKHSQSDALFLCVNKGKLFFILVQISFNLHVCMLKKLMEVIYFVNCKKI